MPFHKTFALFQYSSTYLGKGQKIWYQRVLLDHARIPTRDGYGRLSSGSRLPFEGRRSHNSHGVMECTTWSFWQRLELLC